MNNFKIDYFGEINTDQAENCYHSELKLNGRQISIDLNINTKTPKIDSLKLIQQLITNLDELKNIADRGIKEDFENETEEAVQFYIDHHFTKLNESVVKLYIEHHLAELNESGTRDILIDIDDLDQKEKLVLETLHLKRVGFYIEEVENIIEMDYTIGEKYTDYLIVVRINKNKEIMEITMES